MVGFLISFCAWFQTAAFTPDIPAKHVHAAPVPTSVVASVDGVEIKAKDVEDYLWQWRGAEVTRDLVEYQLVKAEAARRNIVLKPADVEAKVKATLDAITEQNQGKDIDEVLQAQGFTTSRLYLRVAREMLLEKMVEGTFKPSEFVKLSAITIKPGPTKALEAALIEAKDAAAKLAKGSKWEEVLATTTSDANVLQSGGMLGWRSTKILPESTVAELATLKAGQYTKPVQTTAGVQIFRLEAKGDQVPSEQAAELKSQFIVSESARLDRELRSKAKIVNYKPAKSTN